MHNGEPDLEPVMGLWQPTVGDDVCAVWGEVPELPGWTFIPDPIADSSLRAGAWAHQWPKDLPVAAVLAGRTERNGRRGRYTVRWIVPSMDAIVLNFANRGASNFARGQYSPVVHWTADCIRELGRATLASVFTLGGYEALLTVLRVNARRR